MLLAVAAFGVVASCSDEQRRSLDRVSIELDLQKRTTNAVISDGSTVEGVLDCDVTVAEDSKVTGSCDGQDVAGNPITTTLTGTVDLDKAECDSELTIVIGDDTVVHNPSYDCLG
jgi:hypothetical protein